MRSRNLYALLVIAIVIMASMVVILRGKGQQTSVVDVSDLNSLESAYYLRLNNTVWQDSLNNPSPWHLGYSQPNMAPAILSANGTLSLNATFNSESYPQAVNLYRPVNFSLTTNPVLVISLEVSPGIHYGIRIAGQDSAGVPFQAWSENSYLQHRSGLGRTENFTISAVVEAYKTNGIFSAIGSSITSLQFYLEAAAQQSGQFFLNVHKITEVIPNQYSFNPSNRFTGPMDGIVLTVNTTNNLGYSDNQFAQGYLDYYVGGTTGLSYTVYYVHGLTVVGQGYLYSSSALTYNIASFSSSNVRTYPPFLAGNDTFSIILAPSSGSFETFQLAGFSLRYLSQAPMTTTPADTDATTELAYYLVFLFVTPVAIVILVSRLFVHETNETS